MKKILLTLTIIQIFVISLHGQMTIDEKEQFKQINEELVVKFKEGKIDDAFDLARKAVDLSIKIYGAESIETATTYKNLGIIYRNKKKYKDSVVYLQKALDIYRTKPNENGRVIAQTLKDMVFSFVADYDIENAESFCNEALKIALKSFGKDSKELLSFFLTMRQVYIVAGKFPLAQEMFIRQYLIAEKHFLPDSNELQEIEDDFACFVYEHFQINEAKIRLDEFYKTISPDEDKIDEDNIKQGVVNGKAKKLAMPAYPQSARDRKAQGIVSVRITIDESGKVTNARVVCGHKDLHGVSLDAAKKSKFTPTLVNGKPVKVTGTILYNFVP